MTVAVATRNRNFSMHGYSIDTDGDKWKISFTYFQVGNRHKARVRAKCETRRANVLIAPRDTNLILKLWPIQFWPDFAKPLASSSVNGNDGSIQEGLF